MAREKEIHFIECKYGGSGGRDINMSWLRKICIQNVGLKVERKRISRIASDNIKIDVI
jgi:hypothetical protein